MAEKILIVDKRTDKHFQFKPQETQELIEGYEIVTTDILDAEKYSSFCYLKDGRRLPLSSLKDANMVFLTQSKLHENTYINILEGDIDEWALLARFFMEFCSKTGAMNYGCFRSREEMSKEFSSKERSTGGETGIWGVQADGELAEKDGPKEHKEQKESIYMWIKDAKQEPCNVAKLDELLDKYDLDLEVKFHQMYIKAEEFRRHGKITGKIEFSQKRFSKEAKERISENITQLQIGFDKIKVISFWASLFQSFKIDFKRLERIKEGMEQSQQQDIFFYAEYPQSELVVASAL